MLGLKPFEDPNILFAISAFTLGMAGAIFLPGKRTNIALLLYQIALYPLFDVLGIMGSGK